jgi:hypothetical protein
MGREACCRSRINQFHFSPVLIVPQSVTYLNCIPLRTWTGVGLAWIGFDRVWMGG